MAVVFIAAFLIVQEYTKLPGGGVRKFNRQAESLKIGGDIPLKPRLDRPETPKNVLVASKFYVNIAESNLDCTLKYCNLQAALINTMGGWLEAEETGVTIDEIFGLDLEEHKNIKSMIIIGDQNSKIVGIYPNKGLKDALEILAFYPDLADFTLLEGVNKFGALKVGELSPFKPGDSISHLSKKLKRFSIHQIPKNKQFYLYSLESNDSGGSDYFCDNAGCKYLEFADIAFDSIRDLQGWFLINDNDNTKMIESFGLDPQEILNGKSSLVVLTDSKGVIVALHPQKTLSDAITILSHHPDLVGVQKLYRK